MKKISWFDYSFLQIDTDEIISNFKRGVVLGSGAFHFTNVYTIVCADRNLSIKNMLLSEELISDGRPISYILKRKYGKSPQIRGPHFMKEALLKCDKEVRHFFLGSTLENLEAISKKFAELRPDLIIAGLLAPKFLESIDNEVEKWINLIEISNPDIVWVGLGTPKQDIAVSILSKRIKANFIGVGAAFDFLAGAKRETPVWIQRLSLEWFFRLLQEPRRLWRRYIVGNSFFIFRYFSLYLLLLCKPRLLHILKKLSRGSNSFRRFIQ
jgi:N-acetylglucosaminyldiphosphoundecaprenol N-acetyl-beta-D-mannosaminyltransferase